MKITDVVADALTRVRNAIGAKHLTVDIPSSRLKVAMFKILFDEGYIKKYVVFNDGKQGKIKVYLKYNPDKTSVISNLKRISKCGRRIYSKACSLPKVIGGLGIALISTSQGLMTDKQARMQNLGGEVLAYIW